MPARSRLLAALGTTVLLVVPVSGSVGAGPATAAPATPAPTAAAAPTRTVVTLASTEGDYVGGGGSYTYRPETGTIRLVGEPNRVVVIAESPDGDWWMTFTAPVGEQLRPGRYRDAEGSPYGRAPGLRVTGQGRACGSNSWGSFDIHQLVLDDAGTPTRLEATFVQRCESATGPALRGTVFVDAPVQSFQYAAEPGEYVGAGLSRTHRGATSIFGIQGDASSVRTTVAGLRESWDVVLTAPDGQPLRPGTYEAGRFATPTAPGFSAYNSRGCNDSTATVTLRKLRLNEAGQAVGVDLSFVQRCDGAQPALRGTLRYDTGS